MKISDDLTALVFELQRARSPADKAKALARAWRTVRALSPAERRLLAREVGFDGAEDLVEGLAGKSAGAFAPAAVLEALGKMRKDENLSLRGILAGLRDPEQREDLFAQGIDLLAGVEGEAADDETESTFNEDAVEEGEAVLEAEVSAGEVGSENETVPDVGRTAVAGDESEPFEPAPLRPSQVDLPLQTPAAVPETEADDEPEPGAKADAAHEDPSIWDELWLEAPTGEPTPMIEDRKSEPSILVEEQRRQGVPDAVFKRLRDFRDGLDALRGAGIHEIRKALDDLPEPWARRRALVALIEADIPDETGSALELIADMDRLMDRRWCLSALARRGDLAGSDLDRALGMLSSPAARRRVATLAREA